MFASNDRMNYYEVLEVPIDSPQHEIHKAYQRAKSTYSQENPALYSMFTREEARDLLKLVEEAYAVLGNHALRRNYDEKLLKAGAKNLRQAASTAAERDSVYTPEVQHNALPDFVVPDPSIPGSYGDSPDYGKMPPAQPAVNLAVAPSIPSVVAPIRPHTNVYVAPQPPAPTMDPLHTSQTGVRESILVTNSEFTVRKRETINPLPSDTGRCPLGTFKIDLAMEQEIATATTFDGLFLQKIRLYRQVSLEKLSVSSRIGKTYLIALESNDFKNLPATVFLRGFLVQIARQLGLDEGKVITSYMGLAKAALPSRYGP